MNKLTKLLLFIIHLTPLSLLATPDDGERESEVLVGYNSSYYYSIKTIHYPSQTYFDLKDSSFIIERELSNGKLNSKICIHANQHIDSLANGEWTSIEYINQNFNFAKFLVEKKIKYLLPEIHQKHPSIIEEFIIDETGLKIQKEYASITITPIDSIHVFIPWIKEALKSQTETNKHYPNNKEVYVKVFSYAIDKLYLFIQIQNNVYPELQQSIFVIKASEYFQKKNELIKAYKKGP